MLYKIEKEYAEAAVPVVVWTVYERPFVCTKWKVDSFFTSKKAAQDRIRHLKTLKTTIDWEVTYE